MDDLQAALDELRGHQQVPVAAGGVLLRAQQAHRLLARHHLGEADDSVPVKLLLSHSLVVKILGRVVKVLPSGPSAQCVAEKMISDPGLARSGFKPGAVGPGGETAAGGTVSGSAL